jgi:hypothetical protein
MYLTDVQIRFSDGMQYIRVRLPTDLSLHAVIKEKLERLMTLQRLGVQYPADVDLDEEGEEEVTHLPNNLF